MPRTQQSLLVSACLGALLLRGRVACMLAVKPQEQFEGLELVSRDAFFRDQGKFPNLVNPPTLNNLMVPVRPTWQHDVGMSAATGPLRLSMKAQCSEGLPLISARDYTESQGQNLQDGMSGFLLVRHLQLWGLGVRICEITWDGFLAAPNVSLLFI